MTRRCRRTRSVPLRRRVIGLCRAAISVAARPRQFREVEANLSELDGTLVAALQSLGHATTTDPKVMTAFLEEDPEEHLLREYLSIEVKYGVAPGSTE
jgi:hypothetical protein